MSAGRPGFQVSDSSVIVEGTVAKLAESSIRSENAGIEGAARKILSSSQGN